MKTFFTSTDKERTDIQSGYLFMINKFVWFVSGGIP